MDNKIASLKLIPEDSSRVLLDKQANKNNNKIPTGLKKDRALSQEHSSLKVSNKIGSNSNPTNVRAKVRNFSSFLKLNLSPQNGCCLSV